MENRLRRAARAAFRPNAIIMGVTTCVFGWAVAESLRPVGMHEEFYRHFPEELLFLSCTLLAASAGLATNRAWGRLLAVALCSTLPLLQVYVFLMTPYGSETPFLSGEHIERWLSELADIPASVWLMTVLSFAILSSATAATLRRTPSRP